MNITPSTLLKKKSDIRHRTIDNEGIIMCQDSADIIAVNAVGSRILELIDGHKSIDDCLAILVTEFDVEPLQLQQDCLDFILDLMQNDILELA